ncbi:MAG: OmpA family protein [Polyangiaceae bacterium]
MTLRLPLLLSLSAATVLSPTRVAAQDSPAKDGEFSVQRFEPAPGTKNYLSIEGARMEGNWGWSAGLWFNYAREPFVLVSCASLTDCDDESASGRTDVAVVRDLFTWDLVGAVNPIPIVQIGLRVPLSYANGDGIDTTDGGPADTPVRSFGVGDPTLEGKVRIWGATNDLIVLAGAADISAPLGHATAEDAYIGNSSPITGGIRAILDGMYGPFGFGVNLRGVFREDATLGSATVGPEFRYGAGASYRLSPVFRVLAEGYGGTRFSGDKGTNSLEIDGAVQIQPLSSGLIVTVGGGAGVIAGAGVPVARGIASILYSQEVGDQDGDGIGDGSDSCPTVAEDRDGFEDDDGCPEDDNDRDGVPDVSDKCPQKAETINGYLDGDGCPDEVSDRDKDSIPDKDDICPDDAGKVRSKKFYGCPDNDSDGVADKGPAGSEAEWDKCPAAAEDTDGFQDTDGCPDPDNDGDGIPDDADECIDVPEVKNGFKDEDGCPDEAPDGDKDGIADALDKCPTRPENYNGIEDEDGCPDQGPNLVTVTGDELKILERVEFATGSEKIEGPKSFKVLDAVAGALKGHPEIFLVEVAGHTDNAGAADLNRTLSQKRAESVVAYLGTKGIVPQRLTAKGYGPDKPIADNNNTVGKQKNRRVEFNILKSTKKDVAPAPGAPATPAPAGVAPAAPPAPAPKP